MEYNSNIFSLKKIKTFCPKKSTILIRIFDSDLDDKLIIQNNDLVFKNKFEKIYQFYFDDVDLYQFNNENKFKKYCLDYELKPITSTIAKQILNIGKDYDLKDKQIVVHCKVGKSRSPAVLAALNYVFKLNLGNIIKKFPQYNRYVNRIVINASKL